MIFIQSNNCRSQLLLYQDTCKTYTIKEIKPPSFHLGCDYQVEEDGSWSVGTKTYIREAIKRVKEITGRIDGPNGRPTLGLASVPMSETYKPELDETERLDVEGHRKYQQLMGIVQWLITCGRLDIKLCCYFVEPLFCRSEGRALEGCNQFVQVLEW